MSWIHLILAGLLEIGWAISMKFSEGFSKPGFSILTIILMIASFGLLALALKQLPISTAYAIWTGIGAVGTAIIGMAFLGESADWRKVLCIALIAGGIIGLKMSSK